MAKGKHRQIWLQANKKTIKREILIKHKLFNQ